MSRPSTHASRSPIEEEQSPPPGRRYSFGSLIATSVAGLITALYATAVITTFSRYWFNPLYTTSDGTQQLFPFYAAIDRRLFEGDLLYTSMRAYIAPLHWLLGYGLTLLTQSPVMTGHWLMLFQLVPAVLFLFFAVRRWSSTPIAFLSICWFFHTRSLILRSAGGLPRGWAATVLCAYLYFASRRSFWGVCGTIAVGSFLHLPSALLVAVAHGLSLLWVALSKKQTKQLITYIALAPILISLALLSVSRPPEIGTMHSLREAESMSAFSRKNGRFRFLPLRSPLKEIGQVGNKAFVHRTAAPSEAVRNSITFAALALVVAFGAAGVYRRKEILPVPLGCFCAAIFLCYAAARLLAFRLYVPDRYLGAPLAIFFVAALPVLIWRWWRLRDRGPTRIQTAIFVALIGCVAGAVLTFAGTGLKGRGSFRLRTDAEANLMTWARENTPPGSLFASHPSRLDTLPLFAARRVFVNTETAHPFYDRYFEEVSRRLEVTFKAYYAIEPQHIVARLQPEGVRYFLFDKRDFTPHALRKSDYFGVFNRLVKRLSARPPELYAYSQIMRMSPEERDRFVAYEDARWLVLDLELLSKSGGV